MRTRRRPGNQCGVSARIEFLEPRQLLSASALEPTAAEQYMLELINRARANPTAEATADGIDLNEGLPAGTISAAAKQPLAFNPELIAAARNHSNWMLQTQTFAHLEGSADPHDQMQAAGYTFSGSYGWGQNIAYQGQTPGLPEMVPTLDQEEQNLFMDSTEPDRGHRVNILDPAYKELGVGIESGTFQNYNAILATQDFAYESGVSFLTGVAYTDAAKTHFYKVGEGLGGITITATRQSDNAIFSTTTWSAGGYTLALAPGTYTITAIGAGLGTITQSNVIIGSQNIEADFTPAQANGGSQNSGATSGSSGSSSGSSTSTSGASAAGTQSSTTPPAAPGRVSGTIFRDNNSNGIKDKKEPALAKWRVYVDLNNDGIWEANEPSALTNAKGAFQIQIDAGDYTLREMIKSGFVATAPAGGAQSITITTGQFTTGQNFGNHVAPRPKKKAPTSTSKKSAAAQISVPSRLTGVVNPSLAAILG